jgi:hypothetical protein
VLSLFRDVLAASASIPVVFSPMLVDAASQRASISGDCMRMDVTAAGPDFAGSIPAAKRGIRSRSAYEHLRLLVPNRTIDIAA